MRDEMASQAVAGFGIAPLELFEVPRSHARLAFDRQVREGEAPWQTAQLSARPEFTCSALNQGLPSASARPIATLATVAMNIAPYSRVRRRERVIGARLRGGDVASESDHRRRACG